MCAGGVSPFARHDFHSELCRMLNILCLENVRLVFCEEGGLTLETHPAILHAEYVFGISERMLSKTQSCHMFQAGFEHLFQCGDCASPA